MLQAPDAPMTQPLLWPQANLYLLASWTSSSSTVPCLLHCLPVLTGPTDAPLQPCTPTFLLFTALQQLQTRWPSETPVPMPAPPLEQHPNPQLHYQQLHHHLSFCLAHSGLIATCLLALACSATSLGTLNHQDAFVLFIFPIIHLPLKVD